jgi:anti-anti-sigma factor
MDLDVVSDDGNVVRLQMKGRIVQDVLAQQSEPIGQLLGPEGYRRKTLLSLAKTDFIGSSGLSWLLVAHKRFREAGGQLVLHSIPVMVRDVLKVMRLDMVLDVADNESDAAALARGEGA